MIPSAEAEQAAALLMHELAGYRRRVRAESRGRHGRLRKGRVGSGSLPLPYSAVVSMISVAEGFFATTLQTRVESAFTVTSRLMKDAESVAVRTMDSSWDDRMKHAKRWFGIDRAGKAHVTDMLAFVEARNAVAHGVGRLTRRQLAGDEGKRVIADLNSVGVSVVSGLLLIDHLAVERCARSCRSAVIWLDDEAARSVLTPA